MPTLPVVGIQPWTSFGKPDICIGTVSEKQSQFGSLDGDRKQNVGEFGQSDVGEMAHHNSRSKLSNSSRLASRKSWSLSPARWGGLEGRSPSKKLFYFASHLLLLGLNPPGRAEKKQVKN